MAFMNHEISFTPARCVDVYNTGFVNIIESRFNICEGQEENAIVTSTGRFVVAWDFHRLKKGKCDSYVIKQ